MWVYSTSTNHSSNYYGYFVYASCVEHTRNTSRGGGGMSQCFALLLLFLTSLTKRNNSIMCNVIININTIRKIPSIKSTKSFLCGNPKRRKPHNAFLMVKMWLHSKYFLAPTSRRLQPPLSYQIQLNGFSNISIL